MKYFTSCALLCEVKMNYLCDILYMKIVTVRRKKNIKFSFASLGDNFSFFNSDY